MLQRIATLEEAFTQANEPENSVHAGIFTNDLDAAFQAAETLEAGEVMINDSSDYWFDALPFGGFKYGGLQQVGVPALSTARRLQH